MIDLTMFRADHRCGCSPYLCSECNPVRSKISIAAAYGKARGWSFAQTLAYVREPRTGLLPPPPPIMKVVK